MTLFRLFRYLFLFGKGFCKGRQFSVLKLGSFIEVIFSFGFFNLGIDLLYLLTYLLHFGYGSLFILPLGFHLIELFSQLGKFLPYLGQLLFGKFVAFFFQCRFLNLILHYFPRYIIQFRRHGIYLGFYKGTCLIHQINGFIGQESVGYISVGQCCRRY